MDVDTQTGAVDDSVQVVLIGSTGSGKSCTGNTILGKEHFLSDASVKSMTLNCETATEIIHCKQVTVVDTPGWDCTELSEHEVEAKIQEALKNLRGPYSFLLVIRIGVVHSEDINKIYGLQQVLGHSFLNHTTILFSHSDNLEWKTFQEFLQEGDEQFQDLLKACGRRCHSWDNRNRRFEEDVEKVLTDLKMNELKVPVHENRAKQKENFESPMEVNTQTGGADDLVQVVLIGITGSGKSCTGNTILGNKHFPSDASAKSVTVNCKSATEMIHGKRVTVVDTPGWDCTELPEHEIEAKINEALKKLGEPFSFLLVIRIGGVESNNIDKIYGLQQVLGSSFLKHTTILFSQRDNLDQKTFQEFLQEGGPQFQDLLEACGHRCHSWNNRDRRSNEEVEKVLRDLKMTEMDQERSPVEPMQEKKDEQKGNFGKRSRETDTAAVDAPNSKKPIRVIFLGMTKTGKTSSIKTLQAKCEWIEGEGVYSYSPDGLLLQLIDSPAFDQNQKQIQELISKSKPHVIVMVMEVGRFRPAVKKTMQDLQDCLGPNANKHTMILFTGKDDLGGAPIERFIKENADLNRIVEMNGRRFHALNNRDPGDHRQVEDLLQKIANVFEVNKGGSYKPADGGSAQRCEKGKNSNWWSWGK